MTDPRDRWQLSYGNYGSDGRWKGSLVQAGECAAVIAVMHEDYAAPRGMTSRSWEALTTYATADELREAAIRQWKRIGYLSWGAGAVLFIDSEEAAEVKPRGEQGKET